MLDRQVMLDTTVDREWWVMREVKLAATLKHLIDNGDYQGNRRRVSADLGITPAALSQYLKGQTRPSVEKLVTIADLFGVSLDYLMFGEDSVAGSSGTLDYGPIARYMEAGLATARADAAAQSAFVAKIGEIIAGHIAIAAQSAVKRPATFAGMLDHYQALELERFSEESIVVAMDLKEDLVAVEGDIEQGVAAGRFFDIVAENLSRRRGYHFVLSPDMPDRELLVRQFRTLLRRQRLSPADIERCRFSVAAESFYVGFCLFKVDVAGLRAQSPILYNYIEQYIGSGGRIGYTEAPTSDHFAVSLMDERHRWLAQRALGGLIPELPASAAAG
ncbi:helix-turn-helix domain-containing protein [Nocardia sp. ET3-3]|uniref:Helix-turn-helix domain-containing protein n=1 Tax=Nocardia terrae TaxID=2675851 RepID=A0A7K1V1U8_9NOCA|nr:helix-turn-helix transcriptional regulator [Nocardia terrae]MVU80613.1 helix-turn-helix domain-containing protein [Nocardia terrae]